MKKSTENISPSSPPAPSVEGAPALEAAASAESKEGASQKLESPGQVMSSDGSQPLRPRYEQFAQRVAGGEKMPDAYIAAFGGKKGTSRFRAYRIGKRVEVVRRIDFLQKELAAKGLISKEEIVRLLVATIRAKPDDAGTGNPLCELRKVRKESYSVFMDKLGAILQLCKMMGWNLPEKVERKGVPPGEVYVLTEERRRVLMEKKLRAMEANGVGGS